MDNLNQCMIEVIFMDKPKQKVVPTFYSWDIKETLGFIPHPQLPGNSVAKWLCSCPDLTDFSLANQNDDFRKFKNCCKVKPWK